MTEDSSLNNKIRAQDFHGSSACNFAYSDNLLGNTSSNGNSHNGETFYNSTNSNSMMNQAPNNLNGSYHYNELMGQAVNSTERENLIFSSFYNVANIVQQHPSSSNEFSHHLHQQQQTPQQNINYIVTNSNGYGFNTSPSNGHIAQNSLYDAQSSWSHFANETQLKKSPIHTIGN